MPRRGDSEVSSGSEFSGESLSAEEEEEEDLPPAIRADAAAITAARAARQSPAAAPAGRRRSEVVQARHDDEMRRIQRVWEDTKRELQRKRAILLEAGEEEEERRRRMDDDARVFERAALELRRTLAAHAASLQRCRRRCRDYRARLAQAEHEAGQLRGQRDDAVQAMSEARADAAAHREHAAQLSAEMERLAEAQWRMREEDAARSDEAAREQAKRQRESDEQRRRVESLDKLVAAMREQAQNHAAEISRLRRGVEHEEERSAELAAQLAAARSSSEHARQLRARLDDLGSEAERLRQSNQRLLLLLQRHGDFGALAADLAYAGPPAEHPRQEEAVTHPRPGASCGRALLERDRSIVPARETDYWIPMEVFRLVNAFKHRLFPAAAAQPFYDLLVECNKVWRAKEVRAVEVAERRLRKELAQQRRKDKEHRDPAPPLQLANVAQDLAALRRELLRHRSREAYVPAAQHTKALESATALVEQLMRRAGELEAAALHSGPGASTDRSRREWAAAQREAARRCSAAADETAARVLALCADSQRCLASASAPPPPPSAGPAARRAAGALAAIVEIQQDFVARVQGEVTAMRDSLGSVVLPAPP